MIVSPSQELNNEIKNHLALVHSLFAQAMEHVEVAKEKSNELDRLLDEGEQQDDGRT